MKRTVFFMVFFMGCLNAFPQWTLTNCPDEYSITCMTGKGDSVLAVTNDILYVSADQGNTWTVLSNGLPFLPSIHCVVTQGSGILLGTADGIYLSTDDGQSFTWINNELAGMQVFSLLKYGGTICAGATNVSGLPSAVFYTTNLGMSWNKVGADLPSNVNNVKAIAVISDKIFAGTNQGVFARYPWNSDTASWIEINSGIDVAHLQVTALELSANDGYKLYCGTESGLYRTLDFYQWEHCQNGWVGNEWITSLFLTHDALFVGVDYGGGFWMKKNWETLFSSHSSGLSSMQVKCLATTNDYVFAGTGAVPTFYTGGVYRQLITDLVNVPELPSDQHNIQVYPNPVSDFLSISFFSNNKGRFSAEIFNNLGMLVLSQILEQNEARLNVKSLPAGCYFLKIKSEDSIVATAKFVKNQ